ncbi:DUF4158 domain-containing protein [Nonomuraea dietziae]|uniref:DUF4158 domain-containing protein n=1 Tax=Nonomuraea dietziae TaxID=65515 RepID=UPI0031D6D085
MPVDFLSDEQVARYRRFRLEVSVADLEQFFRLDAKALEALAGKRRPATRLGWAVQWGTVWMLGTFLAEDPLDVPMQVLEFVAEQLDIDPACAPEYVARPKPAYEHAWEIRDLLELTEFSKREQEVRDYLAARVWWTIEGPRALFDRAVVHMLREGILLPAGITTLTRLISEVRRAEHARLYRTLAERAGPELRAAGRAAAGACRSASLGAGEGAPRADAGLGPGDGGGTASGGRDRWAGCRGGGHRAGVGGEAGRAGPVRLASKAPTLRDLEGDRQAATLLATVRHLETSSVDDALDVLDLLITSNLLARAERAGKAEQLRTFPKLRKAARTMASAVEVLMSAREATEDRLVSLVEVWKAIEEVVPREKLASAVQTVAAFVPTTDDDAAAEWRAELVKRYRTVQGFIELLLEVIRFRAVEGPAPRCCDGAHLRGDGQEPPPLWPRRHRRA